MNKHLRITGETFRVDGPTDIWLNDFAGVLYRLRSYTILCMFDILFNFRFILSVECFISNFSGLSIHKKNYIRCFLRMDS